MKDTHEFVAPDQNDGPSRTQLKKDAEHMQDIGERLIKLSNSDITKIPMPEILADAVMLARRLTSNEGLRRQRQLIGKIMRKIEAEPIIEALKKLDSGHADNVREQHTIERWIQALFNDNPAIYDEIKKTSATADLQPIHQLLRNAKKEQMENKPPKSKRALFKYLREIYETDRTET